DRALVEVGLSLGEQPVRDLPMTREPGALEHELVVPVEAEPGQTVEDDAGVLFGGALLIRVLDPQQELPAGMARVQPVEERGARTADVQVACRGGGEA